MKKQLTVALGLAVLATPAFATKARLEALGEDNFGSYYINDNRNQFLNPAQITNHRDLVNFEFGATAAGTSAAGDAVSAPRAEGGINKAYGNMVYGLQFGNVTPTAVTVRNLVGGNNLQERNPIDLFVGGDAGVKWGAAVTYEEFDGGSGADRLSSHAIRLRGGAIMGDTQAFAQVSIGGDAKDFQGREVEGKNSYFVGAAHAWMGNTLFADYKNIGAEFTSTGASLQDWDFTEYRLGLGRVERLNDRANLYAKASVERREIDNDGTNVDLERWLIPLNLGVEYDATSWLTLRTSVGYYAWSKQDVDTAAGDTSVQLANTAVRAGASLKFGDFVVDGLISTDGSGGGSATDATTSGGNGTIRTDSLMTRVAMLYRF